MRWTYGAFVFEINPNGRSTSTKLVSDDVRTLTGALVSQPSYLEDSHSLTARVYQPRTKLKAITSFPNGISFDFYVDRIYVLNKINDRIDVYYKGNLTYETSYTLSSITTNKSYLWLATSDINVFVASLKTSPNGLYIHKLSTSGVYVSTLTLTISGTLTGYTYFGGYHWILNNNGGLTKIRPTDGAVIATYSLPVGLQYEGLTHDGDFLIAGNKDSGNKIYHIDSASGKIINQLIDDSIGIFNGIGYDGKQFFTLDSTTYKVQIIQGNLVECQIYKLQAQIMINKYVNMIDHVGISRRLFIKELRISRVAEFEHMYDLTMSVIRIDRG